MSYAGMAGMRATLGDVSGLIGVLDDGDWATASAAAGWTVKDVVTHFGDLLGILASAIAGTLSTDLGIERLNDAHIAAKASCSPGQAVAGLERPCSPSWSHCKRSRPLPPRRSCSTSAAIRCRRYRTCFLSTS